MKISVIVTAYYRRENLRRCLDALSRQRLMPDQIIVADDAGNRWAEDWAKPPFEYLNLRGDDALPRGCNMAVLTAWERLIGDYVIVTFSDILAPSYAVETMLNQHQGDRRSSCVVYGLDRYTTEHLDNIPWKETDCEILRYLPGFWDWPTISRSANSGASGWKHHINFSGNTRKAWEAWGDPLLRTEQHGTDETYTHKMEMEHDRLPFAVDLEVYHQWHQQTLAQTRPELARREFIRRKLGGLEEGEWRYPDGSTA